VDVAICVRCVRPIDRTPPPPALPMMRYGSPLSLARSGRAAFWDLGWGTVRSMRSGDMCLLPDEADSGRTNLRSFPGPRAKPLHSRPMLANAH